MSGNHARHRLSFDRSHDDAVCGKRHVRIAGRRQNPHLPVGFGDVNVFLRRQGHPALLIGQVREQEPVGRTQTSGSAAQRDCLAAQQRIGRRRGDAALARDAQRTTGLNATDCDQIVAGEKYVAGRGDVNTRILPGELDTDRAFQRNGYRAGSLVPNHIVDIGSRERLVKLKPLFGGDIQIGKIKRLRIEFSTDAARRVDRHGDPLGLNVRLTGLRHGPCLRIYDRVRDGEKQLLLAPAIVVLGRDRLRKRARRVGLLAFKSLLEACHTGKAFLQKRIIGFLLGRKAFLRGRIKIFVCGKAVVVAFHDVGLRVHVRLPTLPAVVAAVRAQNSGRNPPLDTFLRIALI